MPILKPLSIPTHGKSTLYALKIWIFTKRQFVLIGDFQLTLNGTTFYMPAGFVFDGASVPRFMTWLFNPVGILLIPALFHDYMYKNRLFKTQNEHGEILQYQVDREKADLLFRDLAIHVNGFKILNYLAWFGIRVFGFLAWSKKNGGKRELK